MAKKILDRFKNLDPKDLKPFYPTKGDLDILQLLQEFECLPAHYIPALLKTAHAYTLDRLGQLRHDYGAIECPEHSWDTRNARYRHAMYSLTDRGMYALQEANRYRPTVRGNDNIKHKNARCIALASFKLGCMERGLEFITPDVILSHSACPRETKESDTPFRFHAEYRYHTPSKKLIEKDGPIIHDAPPFGIAHMLADGQVLRMFIPGIEVERGTKPGNPEKDTERQSRVQKINAVLSLLKNATHRRQLGIPNATVPIITTNEHDTQLYMSDLDFYTHGKGRRDIIFKCVPEFTGIDAFPKPTGFMLAEPWQRVGYPPLNILEELGVK